MVHRKENTLLRIETERKKSNMESFFNTHTYLVEHTTAPVRRILMDEIDWSDRMICIKGTRGVGKTTFLLQYAKEHFDIRNRQCLYVNMNNFYFQQHSIVEFATNFYRQGGRTLLIDQVFKQPHWSRELRKCYDTLPGLKIVFTSSTVMRMREDTPELSDIVQRYYLRGFSFREYLTLQTGIRFSTYKLDDILRYHDQIVRDVLSKVSPAEHFQHYLHHGFYPFFLEHGNFQEHLLEAMNSMTEVDILLIKQIELKYLSKIKKLFYLLAMEGPKAPNISNLAAEIETSRATVMNYIKYLADARLINILYHVGDEFPKKPAKVMMHNPNMMYSIYPITYERQEIMETYFVNSLWKDHTISQGSKDGCYVVDGKRKFRICPAHSHHRMRTASDTIYAQYGTETSQDGHIPLWLFGFVY